LIVYERIKFLSVKHNIGNGFSLPKKMFKAPVTGLYEFQLKVHNGDQQGKNRTCAALATDEDNLEFSRIAETCLSVNASSMVATHLSLRTGEVVVPVFTGLLTSSIDDNLYDGGNEWNELTQFSGMLVQAS
jgi:hypothetical protein